MYIVGERLDRVRLVTHKVREQQIWCGNVVRNIQSYTCTVISKSRSMSRYTLVGKFVFGSTFLHHINTKHA